MRVLVVVASKHGSTHEIAEAIGQELLRAGHAADVRDVEDVRSLEAYDAFIVGSAIYLGNWMREARQFVEQHRATLATAPAWLFSSGPVGEDPPIPTNEPAHLDELMQATQARAHRMFVGKLDKSKLGIGERLAVRAAKSPEGDFRDWDEIAGWAREIAHALESPVEPTS